MGPTSTCDDSPKSCSHVKSPLLSCMIHMSKMFAGSYHRVMELLRAKPQKIFLQTVGRYSLLMMLHVSSLATECWSELLPSFVAPNWYSWDVDSRKRTKIVNKTVCCYTRLMIPHMDSTMRVTPCGAHFMLCRPIILYYSL